MDETNTYQHSIRVYAEDVDYMGIVYHANYISYFERARTEMLRQNNMMLTDLMKKNVLFAVYEIQISYKSPARLDDLLTVHTRAQPLKACSFLFNQTIRNQENKLISEAKIQVVSVDANLRPKAFSSYKMNPPVNGEKDNRQIPGIGDNIDG